MLSCLSMGLDHQLRFTVLPLCCMFGLGLLLIHSAISAGLQKVICRPGWLGNPYPGNCLKIVEEEKTFSDAEAFCETEGGTLVKLKDCSTNIFLSEELQARPGAFWIGLKRESPLPFRWVGERGDRVRHLSWWYFNPNVSGNSACAVTNVPGIAKGKWIDVACNKLNKFVCQISPVASCPPLKYGEGCTESCSGNCAGPDSECHPITGNCLEGCVEGFAGPACDLPCVNRTYGMDCEHTCSPHCAGENRECEGSDGSCTHGCREGFVGLTCKTPCETGEYGMDCSEKCSRNCAGRAKQCDNINGTCLMGCVRGIAGDKCDVVKEEPYDFSLLVVAAMCASSTLALLVITATILSNFVGVSKGYVENEYVADFGDELALEKEEPKEAEAAEEDKKSDEDRRDSQWEEVKQEG